jgi:amino acid transporter
LFTVLPNYCSYVICLGLLLPAWAFTGLDSAEYMAEETQRASRMQPRAILMGCVAMFVFGLGLIISLLFSMPVSHSLDVTHCRWGHRLFESQ